MSRRTKAASNTASRADREGSESPQNNTVSLEKIIGTTSTGNTNFVVGKDGNIAWTAGCVAVVYNPKRNCQTHFLMHPKRTKSLSSIDLSPNGKYLAVGEGFCCDIEPSHYDFHEQGSEPSVLLWDLETQTLLTQFNNAHKFGVEIVKFSADGRYLVSVGFEHDQSLSVWDLACVNKAGAPKIPTPVAKSTLSGKILSVSFASDCSFFVTAGVKHLKFWSMMPIINNTSKSTPFDGIIAFPAADDAVSTPSTFGKAATAKKSIEDPIIDDKSAGKDDSMKIIALEGRPAIARAYRDVSFTDVVVSPTNSNITYVVTDNGHLVAFNSSSRVADKFVEVKSTKVSSLSFIEGVDFIACACANGVVRLFHPTSLDYISSMPRPNPLGREVKSRSSSAPTDDTDRSLSFADTICCRLSFSDGQIRLACLYANKSIFVWDATNTTRVGKYRSFLSHSSCVWSIDSLNHKSTNAKLPPGAFVTASTDGTLKIWNFDSNSQNENIYSKELLESIHVGAGGEDQPAAQNVGVRCVRFSPDGSQIASGDRSGTLRIYDVASVTQQPRLLMQEDAHDDEVLALAFSEQQDGTLLLASGSRDRCIHIFGSINAENNTCVYTLRTSLEEHSSSVTSLAFSSGTESSSFMASAGSDKAVLIRKSSWDDVSLSFSRAKRAASQGAIYDISFDITNNYLLTVGQEKRIAIYDAATAKLVRALKLDSEAGAQLDVEVDPSGQFVATLGQDRTIRIFNLQSGELVASRASGHAELATGCKFSHDGNSLVTIGGDGCIFIWKLPQEPIGKLIKARLSSMISRIPTVLKTSQKDNTTSSSAKNEKTKTSEPQQPLKTQEKAIPLPQWARTAVRQQQLPGESSSLYDDPVEELHHQAILRGKWATRAAEPFTFAGITFRFDPNAPSVRSLLQNNRRNSTTPSDDPTLFFQTKAATSTAAAAASTASTNALEEEKDDFIDPAQLENMWSAFKEEPLDRLLNKPGVFDSLLGDGVKPKPSNPNRLSLSAKYRKNHKAPVLPETSAIASAPSNAPGAPESSDVSKSTSNTDVIVSSSQEGPAKPKDRKELIAEEVERTRKRLMEMGMLAGSKKPTKPVLEEPKHTPAPVEEPAVAPMKLEPAPVEPVEPIVADEATSRTIEEILDQDELEAQQGAEEIGDDTGASSDQSDQADDDETLQADADDDESIPQGESGVGETQEFLNNLSNAFDRTVELYLELKNANRQDEVVGTIGNFFVQVREKLDRVLEPSSSSSSSQNQLLEKYSDLLLQMVSDKLSRK